MAMIRPETEMKESGASWMGKIPCEWSVSKLKWYLRRIDPRNPGDKQVLSLYREYGVIPKDSRDDNHNATSEDTSKYKYVRVGDFVVNKMKAWQGSVAVSEYDGIVSPAYYVYHFTDDSYHRRYFHYLLRSCYKEEFMRLSGGIRVGQWDLSSKDLDNVLIVIPKKEEQQAIADYLDETCFKIDEIIAEAKASIDEYKELKQSVIFEAVTKGLDKNVEMKDSKIEQIGKIPQNWSAMRIKNILFERNERTVDGHEEKLSVTQQYGIVKSSEIQIPNPSDSFDGYRVVSVGDIVFNKYKAHSGVFFASPYDGIVTFNYSVYRCYGNQNPIYYEYLFHTQAFIDEFKRRIYGVGESISPLYSKNLLPIPVIVPPLVEQNLIVDYIKKKTQQIDSLIAEKESLINDLEAYKKSLIYEVVTGKRRVV